MAASVVIVDDHPGFRSWARSLLEAEGFHVVAETADGRSGLMAVRDLGPDLVLLDVTLPDGSGFDVADALAELAEPPLVVLVSSREAADYGRRLAGSRAACFLSKHELSGSQLWALLGGAR